MTVISFRPEQENLYFIENHLKNVSKTDFINGALKNYRVYLLRKELREGFSFQDSSDLDLCNTGFEDYISIIEANDS